MIKLKINKIVRFLLLSDLVFWTGWGLVSPIFAIYIVDNIHGGNEFVIGVATSIYWILSSVLRIPIGIFLDSRPDEKTDYYFMLTGLLIASLVSFGFIFASLPWHIYLLQVFHAVGLSMNFSGWTAIFTRHIDKGHEATEWGISSTSIGIGTGISALIGGWAVTKIGFNNVFTFVGIFGILGTLILIFIRKEIEKDIGHGLYFSFKDLLQRGAETKK